MAVCKSCSAALEPNTNRCHYCGVRNDVDLEAKHEFSVSTPHSNRICPHCNITLQTIELKMGEALYIERCNECFGLFFDPGEIDILLNSTVTSVDNVNLKHIQNINKDRYQSKKVKYIKCPECRMMMNRVNFGYRSGVVIDQCRKHGIWLDNGEITHLMEWKKAGGQLLDQQKNPQKLVSQQKQTEKIHASPKINSRDAYYARFKPGEPALSEQVVTFISRLFD